MSTELTTIDASQFLALSKDSEIAETILANRTAGEQLQISDLIRVPTPAGGGTTWVWDGAAGEESSKDITGLLVAVVPRGTLWPSTEPTDSRPVLVSNDLITAHLVLDPDEDDFGDIDLDTLMSLRKADGTWDWPSLPWNQWGSGSGKGKRCKESRMLFVLRPQDAWPMLVQAPPGSLKAVRQFVSFRLPAPHYRCVVSLALEKVVNDAGQPFSRIKPTLVSVLDKEAGDLVRTLYTEPIKQMCSSQQFNDAVDREPGDETEG